jgi:hypothetical protein
MDPLVVDRLTWVEISVSFDSFEMLDGHNCDAQEVRRQLIAAEKVGWQSAVIVGASLSFCL